MGPRLASGARARTNYQHQQCSVRVRENERSVITISQTRVTTAISASLRLAGVGKKKLKILEIRRFVTTILKDSKKTITSTR